MAGRGALATGTIILLCAVACGGPPPEGGEATPVETASAAPAADAGGAAGRMNHDALAAEVAASATPAVDDGLSAEEHRRLGRKLHASNHDQDAVAHFERAAELDPGPESLLDLALAYGAISDGDRAEATYRRLLQLRPDDAIALHNLGNLALKRGRTDESIGWYGAAVKARPDYLLAWFHLAEVLNQAGHYREAYRAYERTLGLEPRSKAELDAYDDSLYGLASLDMMMGAADRAEQELAELLRANPQHHAANFAYAQVLLAQGRDEEARLALEAHRRVMESRPAMQAMSDPAHDFVDDGESGPRGD